MPAADRAEAAAWRCAAGQTAMAADIAHALGLRGTAPGTWRGPCPICGGSRRFQLREGERAPLLWCFSGCSQRDLLVELRRRGLLPERERAPQDAQAQAELRRRREEVRCFSRGARLLAELALERMRTGDPGRSDLTNLLERLRLDSAGEVAWWKQKRPDLFQALLAAGRRQEKRWRARAAAMVDAAAGGAG